MEPSVRVTQGHTLNLKANRQAAAAMSPLLTLLFKVCRCEHAHAGRPQAPTISKDGLKAAWAWEPEWCPWVFFFFYCHMTDATSGLIYLLKDLLLMHILLFYNRYHVGPWCNGISIYFIICIYWRESTCKSWTLIIVRWSRALHWWWAGLRLSWAGANIKK